jgi:hypothetical protein
VVNNAFVPGDTSRGILDERRATHDTVERAHCKILNGCFLNLTRSNRIPHSGIDECSQPLDVREDANSGFLNTYAADKSVRIVLNATLRSEGVVENECELAVSQC